MILILTIYTGFIVPYNVAFQANIKRSTIDGWLVSETVVVNIACIKVISFPIKLFTKV